MVAAWRSGDQDGRRVLLIPERKRSLGSGSCAPLHRRIVSFMLFTRMETCGRCANDLPDTADHCPHCAWPLSFPNVRRVERPEEVSKLEQRYDGAVKDLERRGCADIARKFVAKAAATRAVIGRPVEEALRLAKSDEQAYASYWDLLHAGVRIPGGSRWDWLRGVADGALFKSYRDKIRFASLSVDGACLPHYGEVSLELSEPMIAHRATVFEENSAIFFDRHRDVEESEGFAGRRARWADRGKLALAKHAPQLSSTSTEADFASILLHPSFDPAHPEDDVFIEVHIYGSLTRRSLSRVIIDTSRASATLIDDLRTRLKHVGVFVEER